MQDACGKNPSFPWCTWQPKASLSIPSHQPTGLQHSACWFFSEQTVLSSVCAILSSNMRLWVAWQDCKKMLFYTFVLFWVCLSEQESSLLGFLLFFWSCHLWLNSYPLLMLPKKKKENKLLLLIDLIGIFYQFHRVPSHVPRLCPHAESSHNVPVVHLPQQYLRKVNRSWTQLHQTRVADRPGPVYLSRKVNAVWRGFLCCFSWQHSWNQGVLSSVCLSLRWSINPKLSGGFYRSYPKMSSSRFKVFVLRTS